MQCVGIAMDDKDSSTKESKPKSVKPKIRMATRHASHRAGLPCGWRVHNCTTTSTTFVPDTVEGLSGNSAGYLSTRTCGGWSTEHSIMLTVDCRVLHCKMVHSLLVTLCCVLPELGRPILCVSSKDIHSYCQRHVSWHKQSFLNVYLMVHRKFTLDPVKPLFSVDIPVIQSVSKKLPDLESIEQETVDRLRLVQSVQTCMGYSSENNNSNKDDSIAVAKDPSLVQCCYQTCTDDYVPIMAKLTRCAGGGDTVVCTFKEGTIAGAFCWHRHLGKPWQT